MAFLCPDVLPLSPDIGGDSLPKLRSVLLVNWTEKLTQQVGNARCEWKRGGNPF